MEPSSSSNGRSGAAPTLARARAGDELAFADLVDPWRRELHAHGYRMLGSYHDAEEALQDTLLRAWRGLDGFEERSSLRTWLHTILTNVCLTRIARRPPRLLPMDVRPASRPDDGVADAVEAGWIGPYPDDGDTSGAPGPAARFERLEAVELAFVAALQHLPATPRAALLLRDVLGFTAKETANMLDVPVSTVTSALQRGRTAVAKRLPDRSQQRTLRALGDARVRDLAHRYATAWERQDLDTIVELLADDVTFAMPPSPTWLAGRADVARFLALGPLRTAWQVRPCRVNGQLAMAFYERSGAGSEHVAHSIDVLTLRDGSVAQIAAFLDEGREAFAHHGLPEVVWSAGPVGDRTF